MPPKIYVYIFNSTYLQLDVSSTQYLLNSMHPKIYVSSTQCILNLCIFNLMYIPLNVLHCSYISFNSMRLELNVSLKHCQRHNGPRLGVLRLDWQQLLTNYSQDPRQPAAYLIFVNFGIPPHSLRPVEVNQEEHKYATKKTKRTKQAKLGRNIAFSVIKSILA